jgi:hypothetical protein
LPRSASSARRALRIDNVALESKRRFLGVAVGGSTEMIRPWMIVRLPKWVPQIGSQAGSLWWSGA